MTILNTYPVLCEGLLGGIGVFVAIVCFICIFIFLNCAMEYGSTACGILSLVCIILCFAGFITFVVDDDHPTGKYRYEILLDDLYPASKLNENYDVIEQRGEIFVIEDKEAIDK